MHFTETALCLVLLVGCATEIERPTPTGASQLTPEEAAAAQTAVLHGDVTISILGPNGADYYGTAIIRVHTGDYQAVDLALVGRNPLQASETFGGDLVVPSEYAYTLASSGWNFSFARPNPDNEPMALIGQRLQARFDRMTMHADPDGMFFATLDMTDAVTSESRTVTLAGRLTGGCEVNDGGSVMTVADLSAVPACESVLGGL